MVPTPAEATIVVGVDGSDSSVEAPRFASKLAPTLGASIHAIACWHFPYMYAGLVDGSDIRKYENDARQRLDDSIAKAFSGEHQPQLKTSLLNGPAASTLMEHSAKAAMLVLGRRGHGGSRDCNWAQSVQPAWPTRPVPYWLCMEKGRSILGDRAASHR